MNPKTPKNDMLIKSHIELIIKIIPPHLALRVTYMAPTIPTIDANRALNPNSGIKSKEKIPPNNPNIPPTRPNANSMVLDVFSSCFSLLLPATFSSMVTPPKSYI
ncbi:hypothetical protein [uncultured Methanobacterium sp.]|uniref:hypothetical protein n=1 Tax=uncultured Methanobacterium sp. TaxID=176306 RepID=UPI002AA7AB51|nr:hypothetical protein [uncultured Methanobacterium sp.]